jgi:preprotein translocase SecF subunit
MELIKPNTNVPFMAYKKKFMGASAILALVSIAILATQGLNYGIDFKGGVELQYRFEKPVSVADLRSAISTQNLGGAVVQEVGGSNPHEFIVAFGLDDAVQGDHSSLVTDTLRQTFKDQTVELRRVDSVGPRVGSDLKKAGILSVLYIMLIMLGYIWFRFELVFSPAAVVALVYNVVITLGMLSLFRIEFSLTAIAAILTLVGYSINDTIVVFDRIRENVKQFGKIAFDHIIDRSLNETLSRTLLTGVTTFLVVLILAVFGGETLFPFAFTFAVGLVIGTYSSIYIASPIAFYLDAYFQRRREAQPRRTS